jgi:hypothetical protein
MNSITLETIKPSVRVNKMPESSVGFWEMTLELRQAMNEEGITLDDRDFRNLRDRSAGRKVSL